MTLQTQRKRRLLRHFLPSQRAWLLALALTLSVSGTGTAWAASAAAGTGTNPPAVTATAAPAKTASPEPAADTKTPAAPDTVAVPADQHVIRDPFAGVDDKWVRKYCLTKGRTYDKVTKRLREMDPQRTGLPVDKDTYYFRVDKKLTDKYFRHIRADRKSNQEQIGDYYVSKDDKSVWRLDGPDAGMLEGSAKKVLDKTVILLPAYLLKDEEQTVRLRTPGNVPYTVRVKSLDENVVRAEDDRVIPVRLGKADVYVEATSGDAVEGAVVSVRVVTRAERQRLYQLAYERAVYRQRLLESYMYWDGWGPWGYGPWGYGPYYHGPRPRPPRGHRPPPPPHKR